MLVSKFRSDPEDYYEDVVEDVVDELGLYYISEFYGDAMMMDDKVDCFTSFENYEDDVIYYLPLKRRPSLFKTAYSSVEEIVKEIKDQIGKYLPDDFDYRTYICEIQGSYYG